MYVPVHAFVHTYACMYVSVCVSLCVRMCVVHCDPHVPPHAGCFWRKCLTSVTWTRLVQLALLVDSAVWWHVYVCTYVCTLYLPDGWACVRMYVRLYVCSVCVCVSVCLCVSVCVYVCICRLDFWIVFVCSTSWSASMMSWRRI